MGLVLWVWVIAAALLLVGELLTNRLILLSLALGAGAAALLAAFQVEFPFQLIAFALVSAALLVATRPFVRSRSQRPENVFGVERLIGKEGIVTVNIDPRQGAGRVRVARETWPADSEDGQVIRDGTRVQVLAIDGKRLRVRPLPTADRPASRPISSTRPKL